ncbi:Bro-N domain-containing protein [Shewanella olleyana]|uniref:BRO family protein n=1 Tax=Shewanella olleyana TaxID=135626 RepID=UPI00200D38A5|nr:Bro-N domain-containing protein [Shewanella olleyana]MCL1067916.1 Bro-N domain-containing protein [Shewanella olleyana]
MRLTFGNLTAIDKDGGPWFVGKEVAEKLGYSNAREAVRTHCKKAKDLGAGFAPLSHQAKMGF